jgi:hypothetical protein
VRALPRAIVVSLGMWALSSAPLVAQIDAGLLAKAGDRELSETFDASANRTEVRLSLVPSGTGGNLATATLVFVAQYTGRTPTPQSTTLTVRTHITARSDPRTRDPRTGTEGRDLTFNIDPHTASGITLYLYPTSWGYPGFVAPGGEIPVAFFTMTVAELKALSTARAITGRAVGSDFSFAPDQLAALGAFAKRVLR